MKKYWIALAVGLILFAACKEKKTIHSEGDKTKEAFLTYVKGKLNELNEGFDVTIQ